MALLLWYPRACSFPPLSSPLLESPFPAAGDSPIDQPPLTSKDLEDSSNVKPPALGEREQLAKEQEQGQDAEDDGEDHHRLDRLQPFWGKKDRWKPQCWHHRQRAPTTAHGLGTIPCATIPPLAPIKVLNSWEDVATSSAASAGEVLNTGTMPPGI